MEGSTLWLFALASAAIVVVPGPTVTVIVANSLGAGTRAGLYNVLGTQLGLATMVLLLALGLGVMVERLGALFDIVRLFGAAYLVWLGYRLWCADGASLGEAAVGAAPPRPALDYVRQGFLVIWANPKALVFFGAFLPQFVDVERPAVPQLLLLGAVFMTIGAVLDGAYAVLAGRAGTWLTRRRARQLERGSAACLMGGGVWLAAGSFVDRSPG